MHEKNEDQAHQSHPATDWLSKQMEMAIKEIAPNRPLLALENEFLDRLGVLRRQRGNRKRLGIGVGVTTGAGVAADAWLGFEWMEMIESLMVWIGKSMGLAASLLIP